MTQDVDTLRRLAEQAYSRWRAYDALRPRDQAADDEGIRLKAELDHAAQALFAARRPSLASR